MPKCDRCHTARVELTVRDTKYNLFGLCRPCYEKDGAGGDRKLFVSQVWKDVPGKKEKRKEPVWDG